MNIDNNKQILIQIQIYTLSLNCCFSNPVQKVFQINKMECQVHLCLFLSPQVYQLYLVQMMVNINGMMMNKCTHSFSIAYHESMNIEILQDCVIPQGQLLIFDKSINIRAKRFSMKFTTVPCTEAL